MIELNVDEQNMQGSAHVSTFEGRRSMKIELSDIETQALFSVLRPS